MRTRLMAGVVMLAIAAPLAMAQADKTKKPARSAAKPNPLAGARVEVYKTVADVRLKLYIFEPDGHKASDRRPAVVFFFGGGFRRGSPKQFAHQCCYLASRGMVAMAADYRVSSRHKAKVVQCAADGKSAIRWVRRNAERLGIDPKRIAAGGGSAGGSLAAMTGTLDAFDEPGEDTSVSARPDALLLFNPKLDFRVLGRKSKSARRSPAEQRERLGTGPEALSPQCHIDGRTPPTVIFHGKADKTVAYSEAERFTETMRQAKNRCELVGFEGLGHGFFNHGRNGGKSFVDTMRRTDRFLASLGWLRGDPTIDRFK